MIHAGEEAGGLAVLRHHADAGVPCRPRGPIGLIGLLPILIWPDRRRLRAEDGFAEFSCGQRR